MVHPSCILDLSAERLIEAMQTGDLSAVAVTQAFLDQIAKLDSDIRAWVAFDEERALRSAQSADVRRASGAALPPLHGLPIGVKDVFDTADFPTCYGCKGYAERRPSTDAIVVARLRSAGAIIVGKTATAEFAYKHPASTRNPHDLSRTPGGSSSGSAAAVAARMIPVALGTQTKGSVIRPAAFCGVVGYKPGLGALPRTGVLSQSILLDQIGVMARNVADAALLARTMSGPDGIDLMCDRSLARAHRDAVVANAPRLAFVPGPFWNRAAPDAARAIFTFAHELQLPTLALPVEFAEAESALDQLVLHGIAAAINREPPDDFESLSADLQDAVRAGSGILPETIEAAMAVRERLIAGFDTVAAPYDALVTLAAPGVPPPFEAGTGDPSFAMLWNFVGAPAVTLPLLETSDGLPIGVQLVGRNGGDADLVRAAAWVEQSFRTTGQVTRSDNL